MGVMCQNTYAINVKCLSLQGICHWGCLLGEKIYFVGDNAVMWQRKGLAMTIRAKAELRTKSCTACKMILL